MGQDQRRDREVGRHLRRGVTALLIADQQLRSRTTQYRADLAGAGARADADHDGAATLDRNEQDVDSGGVAVPHGHPITR